MHNLVSRNFSTREIPVFSFEIRENDNEYLFFLINYLKVQGVVFYENKKEDNLQDPHQTEAIYYLVEYLFLC